MLRTSSRIPSESCCHTYVTVTGDFLWLPYVNATKCGRFKFVALDTRRYLGRSRRKPVPMSGPDRLRLQWREEKSNSLIGML